MSPSPTSRPFHQVDVFTETALRGNPVAVVRDAEGIDDDTMRALAAWTNLSETTFLLPPTQPGADYRVRIFMPNKSEVPFAGHPTLGSAHTWLEAGGVPATPGLVRQESAIGVVTVRQGDERLAFAAPPQRSEPADPEAQAAVLRAVGLTDDQVVASRLLTNGPTWLVLLVEDAATVLSLEPDHNALRHLPMVGVVGHCPSDAPTRIEVRAFADSIDVPEDPVTGSLQASVAQWLIGEGVLPERYVASQGARLGRVGRVHLEAADGEVWVGGDTRTLVRGELHL